MNGRDGNMHGITCCLRRKQARIHERLRDVVDRFGKIQKGKGLQERQTSLCSIGVSSRRFVEDNLRNAEVVLLALVVPPLVSDLLPGCLKQVTTWPSGQVA